MKRSKLGRIAEIDRSEHVTLGYVYKDGKLKAEEVDWRVPCWFQEGPDFSVEAKIKQWSPELENGGVMLGAFDGDLLVGFVILGHSLRPGRQMQLVALHVSRDYRRQGIATQLFAEISRMAKERGAEALYVSAAPSESAVGFYLSQGCELAKKIDQELYALEPEDIHLIRRLSVHQDEG